MLNLYCQSAQGLTSGYIAKFEEIAWEMEDKMSLLKHCLLQGTEELSGEVLTGMSYIVNDLEDGLTKLSTERDKFCSKLTAEHT